ncbi:O-methyltransferase [Clostridium tepidum]|jgi:predicted O-methyltransferase YrrM|uniref:tRNA 5-hydroxyuridine methyltransferase n=1 Tax=Clostridium tepidum TaxID=1962263 RepID=A0A1S9I833_9CLOT|nr:O-methyltransferase [Clostridium tepidum]MCR1933569.1 O-methyltransferase [Clostridium tepidum]MDU6876919.1 O-methyltransferase [Clostridium botulinum]OOO63502.1 methyltransferase [Clostridium tepidum]OOO66469.1 methyltransferase [Clostridium tepidum]
MSKVAYDYIEKYIRELIPENKGALKELEDYAKENSVPIIHKEVANFLEFMISLKKPKKILELGTAIGYSSIFMSLSSKEECEITTIERDDKMIEIAKNNIERYGFKDKIKIIQGDCLEILKNLEDKYDMIFMDAGKGHYNEFLPYCLKLLNKEGIIIADNVLFRGMVANDELVIRRKITIVKRMRKYMNMISDKKNFITSIIPMGDGIAITKRRNEDA